MTDGGGEWAVRHVMTDGGDACVVGVAPDSVRRATALLWLSEYQSQYGKISPRMNHMRGVYV
jgi:hypothetical protein